MNDPEWSLTRVESRVNLELRTFFTALLNNHITELGRKYGAVFDSSQLNEGHGTAML